MQVRVKRARNKKPIAMAKESCDMLSPDDFGGKCGWCGEKCMSYNVGSDEGSEDGTNENEYGAKDGIEEGKEEIHSD